jgi:hypothetical protein
VATADEEFGYLMSRAFQGAVTDDEIAQYMEHVRAHMETMCQDCLARIVKESTPAAIGTLAEITETSLDGELQAGATRLMCELIVQRPDLIVRSLAWLNVRRKELEAGYDRGRLRTGTALLAQGYTARFGDGRA